MRIPATGTDSGIRPFAILHGVAQQEQERNLIKFRRGNIDADSDWEGTWGKREIYVGLLIGPQGVS